MKGKSEVVQVLREMLREELGAISQYMLHGEMCKNWGYKRLGGHTRTQAIEEMKHAERLIERILFLEAIPNLGDLPKLSIGKDVSQQIDNDLALERGAVAAYNDAVATCRKAGDNTSADLLEDILGNEEEHVDFLEAQLLLIKEVGLQNYLSQQMHE